jgi:hypothetical protein
MTHHLDSIRLTALVTAVLLAASCVLATDYHVNPQTGDTAGDGSLARPWRSLQEVLDQGLVESQTWDALPYNDTRKLTPLHADAAVKPGDTIWLHSGDYGDVIIRKHYNRDFITIAAAENQTPRFRSLRLQSGSFWKLTGLHISPEYATGKTPRTMLDIESHGWNGPVHDIVIEHCVLRSAADTSAWTVSDWNERAASGIDADGERIVIRSNELTNVNFGISVTASHSLIEHNSITNFAGDGLRGLGNHSVFQYNVVKNCYDVNANHDDGFQSWSSGPGGVGTGEVVGITLRGNTIINSEDPQQPHRGTLQGIGCFDGMFVDWVIENNVVIVDHYHGITLAGARGCRMLNNTVLDPNDRRPGPAAIRIGKHKRGMPSANCTVRNNLVSALHIDGENMTVDHNLTVEQPETVFEGPARFDVRLRAGSPAIDSGRSDLAPQVDITGTSRPQGAAVDVGAYEYRVR